LSGLLLRPVAVATGLPADIGRRRARRRGSVDLQRRRPPAHHPEASL